MNKSPTSRTDSLLVHWGQRLEPRAAFRCGPSQPTWFRNHSSEESRNWHSIRWETRGTPSPRHSKHREGRSEAGLPRGHLWLLHEWDPHLSSTQVSSPRISRKCCPQWLLWYCPRTLGSIIVLNWLWDHMSLGYHTYSWVQPEIIISRFSCVYLPLKI